MGVPMSNLCKMNLPRLNSKCEDNIRMLMFSTWTRWLHVYSLYVSIYRSRNHQEVLESILPRFPRCGFCPQQRCVRWRDEGIPNWAPPDPAASSALHPSVPHSRQPPGFTSCPLCTGGMVTFHTKYSSKWSAWPTTPSSMWSSFVEGCWPLYLHTLWSVWTER